MKITKTKKYDTDKYMPNKEAVQLDFEDTLKRLKPPQEASLTEKAYSHSHNQIKTPPKSAKKGKNHAE